MGELRNLRGRGVGWSSDIFFVTDGQKRDYLSNALQRARGATKNSVKTFQYPTNFVKIHVLVLAIFLKM